MRLEEKRVEMDILVLSIVAGIVVAGGIWIATQPSPKSRREQEEPVISHITPSDGNIFADLGFPPEEAARLLAESDARIDAELAAKGLPPRRR